MRLILLYARRRLNSPCSCLTASLFSIFFPTDFFLINTIHAPSEMGPCSRWFNWYYDGNSRRLSEVSLQVYMLCIFVFDFLIYEEVYTVFPPVSLFSWRCFRLAELILLTRANGATQACGPCADIPTVRTRSDFTWSDLIWHDLTTPDLTWTDGWHLPYLEISCL